MHVRNHPCFQPLMPLMLEYEQKQVVVVDHVLHHSYIFGDLTIIFQH